MVNKDIVLAQIVICDGKIPKYSILHFNMKNFMDNGSEREITEMYDSIDELKDKITTDY